MNPHQKNKVDISNLSSDEQRLLRLYGKLPNKKDLLQNKLKERKFFDSGDYALSKAGKASDSGVTSIGTEHPNAENIAALSPLTTSTTQGSISSPSGEGNPHFFSPANMHRGSINGIPGGTSRSPAKESSFLARTTSVDEDSEDSDAKAMADLRAAENISPPPAKQGMPIRR